MKNLQSLSNFKTIKVTLPIDKVLMLTLSRPDVRNALDTVMMRELRSLWTELYQTPGDIRAVVITGEGDKAFCAGADLKECNGMTVHEWQTQHQILEQAMRAMLECPLPILAAVNGAAYGGGLELVLASDFAYSVSEARFAFPEVGLGIIPGAMGTQLLPRAVGLNRAKELCLTGASFGAQEALEWGIVNRIVESGALQDEILAQASKIASSAPIAVKQVKRALDATRSMDVMSGYRFEIDAYNLCVKSEDRNEGIKSFNEKRKPVFRGI